MELIVKRKAFTEKSTIGELWIDGKYFCYTLEDKDRGLKHSDGLALITLKKIFRVTAIPYGRYKLKLTDSARFKKLMPLLLDVLGFLGIRIHSGNKSEDTEGCILVGFEKYIDAIGRSRDAFNELMKLLQAAVDRNEDIYITIEKAATPV